MNVYRHKFVARCPVNGDMIAYRLKIESRSIIRAESIRDACPSEGLHEEIADGLLHDLGGTQTLKATHGGVKIKTVRAAT